MKIIILSIMSFCFCAVLLTGCGGSSEGSSNPPEQSPESPESPATILDDARKIDWSVGVKDGIPTLSDTVNVTDFGAKGDGVSDDTAAFTSSLAALSASGGVVKIPAGTFLLKDTLDLNDNVVLRGSSPQATTLNFDLSNQATSLIRIVKYERGDWMALDNTPLKGASTISVANASQFSVGKYAEIQQDNDADLMYTESRWNVNWAQGSVGQVFRVIAKDETSITVDPPLYFSVRSDLNPVIRPQGLIEKAGIEDIAIERLDQGDGHTIEIKNAADVWVKNVASAYTVKSHVDTDTVLGCEIRDNYFHHSHDYGGGGHGYGVNLSRHTTAGLVENNVFETLRHSMLVQVGAIGNVVAYNYSRDPLSDGSWSPPDISLHGHYPSANLFEGNVVAEVAFSDYWGPIGPSNTLYRSCVNSGGVYIFDHSNGQNMMGNTIVGGIDDIEIDTSVSDTLLHGNYSSENIQWDNMIARRDLPASLYLNEKPLFFGNTEWRSIGPDNNQNCDNPASLRWESGNPL